MSGTDQTALLMRIAGDIGELKGDVKSLLAAKASQDETIEEHAKRLGSIERSRAWLLGVSATVSAGVAAVVEYFTLRN